MTITGNEGTYPQSINRRITELLAYRNGSSFGFTAQGDLANISAAVQGISVSQNGILSILQTNSSTNNEAYVSGDVMYNRQKEPSFYCRFRLTSTSFTRMFIGLTDNTAVDALTSPALNGQYAGLYIDTGAASTFQTMRGSGGSPIKDTNAFSKSIDTDYHNFYMWLKKSGGLDEVSFQLDNNDRVTYNTSIPSASTLMRYVAGVATRTSSSRRIEIAKLSINSEI